jgi:MFS family permease
VGVYRLGFPTIRELGVTGTCLDLLADTAQNAFIPYTLAEKGAQFGDGSTYITYRNSCIIAVLGVPGAMLGGLLVEVPKFGRKGALASSTILTGVFIYGSTTAKTSNQLLAWNCVYSFFSNVMYAVLYAYTPEVFPTKDRGTGNALAATANRVFGIMGRSRSAFPPLDPLTSSQHRSSPCSPTCRRRRQCTPVAPCSLPPVWSW